MDDECDPIENTQIPDQIGGTPVTDPCSEPAEETSPTVTTPTPGVEGDPAPCIPVPFVVYNVRAQAECDPDEDGVPADAVPVIIRAAQFNERVNFSVISGLTEDIRCRLAAMPDYSLFTGLLESDQMTPEAVAAIVGCELDKAELLSAAMQEAQDRVNSTAQTTAELSLSCIWFNDEVTVHCPIVDPPYATANDTPDAVSTYVFIAKTLFSNVSKQDANTRAIIEAERKLSCFWVNDEITLACEQFTDQDGNPLKPVPNDFEPVREGVPLRRGYVSVVAAEFRSDSSKEDANNQALEIGNSLLNCIYFNEEQVVQCDTSEGPAYSADGSPASAADPSTNTPGQLVVIPAFQFWSVNNVEEANEQARISAESLLECCYKSKPLQAVCPPIEVTDSEGTVIEIQPDPERSKPVSIFLPEGHAISCVSQADADAIASADISNALGCVYCNLVELPRCVPEWVINGVLDGSISLPLDVNSLIDPLTGEPPDLSTWSVDATVGVPARQICGEDYISVEITAEAGALIPIQTPTSACRYTNDRIAITCYASLDTAPKDAKIIRIFSTDDPIARGATPVQDTWLIIEPGYVNVTENDLPEPPDPDDPDYDLDSIKLMVKNYANTLAENYAYSLVDCYYENPKTTVTCEGTVMRIPPTHKTEWVIGLGRPDDDFTDTSNTALNPFIVDPGNFISRTSLADVYQKTRRYVQQSITCMYCSPPIVGSCVENNALNSVQFPRCSFVASTPVAAKQMAESMAQTVVCYTPPDIPDIPDYPDPEPGAPGEPGGQKECDGECQSTFCPP